MVVPKLHINEQSLKMQMSAKMQGWVSRLSQKAWTSFSQCIRAQNSTDQMGGKATPHWIPVQTDGANKDTPPGPYH